MESMKPLVEQEHVLEFISVQEIKQEEPLDREEPDMGTVKVEPEDELTTDDYILGLGEERDESQTLLSFWGHAASASCSIANASESAVFCSKLGESVNLQETQTAAENDPISIANYKDLKKLVSLQDCINYNGSHTIHTVETPFDKHIYGDVCTLSCEKGHLCNDHHTSLDYSAKSSDNGNIKFRQLEYPCRRKNKKCKLCGKCFTSIKDLKRHIRIHTGEKNYKCEDCDKVFTEKSTLTRHSKVHLRLKHFKCNECGKILTTDYSLKRHLKLHTADRDYKCEDCGKCFSKKGTLKVHLRMHSGVKSHECEECGKCFSQKATLKKHLQINSGMKVEGD